MGEHTNQFNDAFMRMCYKKVYDIADVLLNQCDIDDMFKYHINPICLTIVRVAADEEELMIKILDKIQSDENIRILHDFCEKALMRWTNGSDLYNGRKIVRDFIKTHLWYRMEKIK